MPPAYSKIRLKSYTERRWIKNGESPTMGFSLYGVLRHLDSRAQHVHHAGSQEVRSRSLIRPASFRRRWFERFHNAIDVLDVLVVIVLERARANQINALVDCDKVRFAFGPAVVFGAVVKKRDFNRVESAQLQFDFFSAT